MLAMEALPSEVRQAAQAAFAPILRRVRARTDTGPDEGLPKVEGLGLFALQMIINHSCDPNGEVRKVRLYLFYLPPPPCHSSELQSVHDWDGRVNVVLVREVRAGEELLNSYRDFTPATPYAQRQRQLRAQFNFECKCTRCTRERPPAPPP